MQTATYINLNIRVEIKEKDNKMYVVKSLDKSVQWDYARVHENKLKDFIDEDIL